MTTQTTSETAPVSLGQPAPAQPARLPRLWPALLLLGLYWTVYVLWRWTDLGLTLGFIGFLLQMALSALVTLLFVVWWLAGSRLRVADRLLVFGAVVAAGLATVFLSDPSVKSLFLVPGVPLVLTAWAFALLAARNRQPQTRRLVLLVVPTLTWALFTLIRSEGLAGDGQPVLRWRWQPTAEQMYLAQRDENEANSAAPPSQHPLTLRPDDWPGFRGADRDGNRRGVRIATDWHAVPPRLIWRRPIGPAWSSIAVVGDRLFTQEQVGSSEAVVCLDATTGRTVWSHQDAARHQDGQAGAGPRATPTFADGRLFALGATGILNCLDAASGTRRWSRNIAADADAKVPIWGLASSPLVMGDLVIVFAGGESEKTLWAYRTDSGKPAWSAAAGRISYSSPQRASIAGVEQVLFVSEQGLAAYDPSSGAVLWEQRTPAGNPGIPRSVQPHVIGSTQVLFDAGPEAGTTLVEVTRENGAWTPVERWLSRHLKPSFNDFVLHGNALYGFDGRVLTCIDLETGQQRWKKGRYGSGQVLLLGDQPLLLVVAENGKVALVAADPDQHQELGRFQAIEGKTWNHPVIARGRLYVRNAQEIACYELRLDDSH
jgi:outer membrane protein assembly factor BamB